MSKPGVPLEAVDQSGCPCGCRTLTVIEKFNDSPALVAVGASISRDVSA